MMFNRMTFDELKELPTCTFSEDGQRAYIAWFQSGIYECYHMRSDGYYYCAGSTYKLETARKYLVDEDVELLT